MFAFYECIGEHRITSCYLVFEMEYAIVVYYNGMMNCCYSFRGVIYSMFPLCIWIVSTGVSSLLSNTLALLNCRVKLKVAVISPIIMVPSINFILHFLLLYGFNSQSLNGVFGFLGVEVSF